MNINKKLIFPIVALAVIGTGFMGTGKSLANDSGNINESIVQRIAEKFGLKDSDVQKVFDEVRNERIAELQAKQEERLTKLVTEGKITQAQKILILNKHKEVQVERETDKDSFMRLTPEERKALMKERRTEIEIWAIENGIDLQYLMRFGEKDHGRTGFAFDKK